MYFIREGLWCQCERSCNWSSGLLTDGISVHACEEVVTGQWKALGRSWELRGGARFQISDAPWFLVSGLPLATLGGDSEPLIKMVQAHFELTWACRRQVFTMSRVASYEPATIHYQIDGRCHFPASEFEAMQEGIYGTDFNETAS